LNKINEEEIDISLCILDIILMPKKKQVTFQNNIPGKFIPRDDTPSASGLHLNNQNLK